MKFVDLILIPNEGSSSMKRMRLPSFVVKGAAIASCIFCFTLGYILIDYFKLREISKAVTHVISENDSLRGEADILQKNLQETKQSLRKVKDYTIKLNDMMELAVSRVTKSAGIGPLTEEDMKIAESKQKQQSSVDNIPIGLNLNDLTFKPVLEKLDVVKDEADVRALELQNLLANLSKRKSLLESVPTTNPVDGWIASGFGTRTSPFTGQQSQHRGLDIAAASGTPIYAPADGVVIFSGDRDSFGNFVMIAHGYGIVSRYGHCAQLLVQAGQSIKRGDKIATVGMTGRTTGPHLHYEVLVNGAHVNPQRFILNLPQEQFAILYN